MAGTKIKGITIDLGVNTKPVTEGFQKINKDLRETDRTLKDIEKGLKLDPKNAELLAQKAKYLAQAIEETNKKLEEEQKILDELEKQDGGTGKYAKQIDAVKREIEDTKQKQEGYKKSLEQTEKATTDLGNASQDAGKKQEDLGKQFEISSLKAQLMHDGIELAVKALGEMVKFVGDSIKASSEYADNMLTMATVTGLSTDQLQEYQYMSELVDVSLDTITGSLSKLTKNMASANGGNKAMTANFEKLGVAITDSSGNLRSADDVFQDAITALGSIQNETERDALAMQIFGKSAQDLNPLIEAGAGNIQAFRDEAHNMGYVLDEETLGSLGAVDDAFQRLDLATTVVQNQIGAVLAPVIADIATKFMEWAQSVDWEAFGQKIKTFIDGAILVIQTVVPIIWGIIQQIIAFWQGFWDFAQGFWDFMVLCWDGIVKTVQDAKDALQPIIDGIVNFFQSVWDIVDKVVGKIGDFIGVIKGAIDKAGEFMSGGFGKVASFFGFGGGGSGGFGPSSMATFTRPAYASGGYSLSTAVTINNYSTPVTGAFADRVAEVVNEKLGRMLK
ncbi:MAG: hypothetical protein IKF05_06360 [Erysipelotrichaceae bacterium]|nr:hypothetical protein [Erysipelotrichaceae bacterium]